MKNKILIYMEEYRLKPIGGPAGYLYNLKCELDKRNIKNIEFIKKNQENVNIKNKIRRMPKFVEECARVYKRAVSFKSLLNNKPKTSQINLNEYEAIHFHNTIDMFKVKDSLEHYNGKVILTSHSPKPMFLEIYEDFINNFERKFLKHLYYDLSFIDKYAFNRADYIVFPCEDAEEPYYNNWSEYFKIKEKNKNKYRYIVTGINEVKPKLDTNEVRTKYNIPKDAFVVSYVGRHNETKGYDKLKEIGTKLLQDKNIYFLIAGQESPLKGLDHSNWIEVGWTNDPHSIISTSDVFVLPNKETYFDIVMLEVLSLGKIVIASNTGGNKYFKKINSDGVLLYDSIEDAINLVKKIKHLDSNKKNKLEYDNKQIFSSKFNVNIFCDKYLDLLENILKN